MMFPIRELGKRANVPTKTIRYYEEIGLLPPAKRAENGYRVYDEADVERLKYIRQSRALDFTLEDIGEILAFRDREELPCDYILGVVSEKLQEIDARIQDLERLRDQLKTMQEAGERLPDDPALRRCVCRHIQSDFKPIPDNEEA
jgi:DNA-binding transcriptional MerR regulator